MYDQKNLTLEYFTFIWCLVVHQQSVHSGGLRYADCWCRFAYHSSCTQLFLGGRSYVHSRHVRPVDALSNNSLHSIQILRSACSSKHSSTFNIGMGIETHPPYAYDSVSYYTCSKGSRKVVRQREESQHWLPYQQMKCECKGIEKDGKC